MRTLDDHNRPYLRGACLRAPKVKTMTARPGEDGPHGGLGTKPPEDRRGFESPKTDSNSILPRGQSAVTLGCTGSLATACLASRLGPWPHRTLSPAPEPPPE